MSKDKDGTIYRRSLDNKWVDKRNDVGRGFVFDMQATAIASGRCKLVNSGGGELTVKGRDGKIRSKDTLGGGRDLMPPRDEEH